MDGSRSATPRTDFFNLPLIPEPNTDGSPLLISVPFPGQGGPSPHLAHPDRAGAALFCSITKIQKNKDNRIRKIFLKEKGIEAEITIMSNPSGDESFGL